MKRASELIPGSWVYPVHHAQMLRRRTIPKFCCCISVRHVPTWATGFDIVKYLAYTIGYLSSLSIIFIETSLIIILASISILHVGLIFYAMFLNRYAGYQNPKTKFTLVYVALWFLHTLIIIPVSLFILIPPFRHLMIGNSSIRSRIRFYDIIIMFAIFLIS